MPRRAADRGAVPLHRRLYPQVLLAIALGIAVGAWRPALSMELKPLGDLYIKLVRMVVAPVIFLTVASGIGGMRDLGRFGRVAGRAMLYFLLMSTLALLLGLLVGNLVRPGAGLHVDPGSLHDVAVSGYTAKARNETLLGFVSDIVPDSLAGALASPDILQVLAVAILFGVALAGVGDAGAPVLALMGSLSAVVFRIVAIVMRAAPVGAFGAMAFTIGRSGIGAVLHLAALIGTFYLTSGLFVLVVLGSVCRWNGVSILRLLRYLRDELLLVLGTSSSEAALPSLIDKLERAGCGRSVVGLVVPTGYSFNLDGTNIYMTLAVLFIAQATGTALSFEQQALILGVAMLSSKGAAGVSGAGFITLAATLSVVPSVPVAGMALILGVDRFMSECRALTNIIGNAVATIVVARWEGELDPRALAAALARAPVTGTGGGGTGQDRREPASADVSVRPGAGS